MVLFLNGVLGLQTLRMAARMFGLSLVQEILLRACEYRKCNNGGMVGGFGFDIASVVECAGI